MDHSLITLSPKRASADPISKQTRPLTASNLVTTKGMYHVPLRGSIARPSVPRTLPRPRAVPTMQEVHSALALDQDLLTSTRRKGEVLCGFLWTSGTGTHIRLVPHGYPR